MAAETKVGIIFEVQDRATRAINDVRGSLERMSGDISKQATAAKSLDPIFSQIRRVGIASFAGIAGAVYAGIKAFGEYEAINRELTETLRTTVDASDEQIEGLRQLAEAQAELGVVSEEATLSAATQLAQFDLLPATIATILPALNDYLVAEKGISATTADATQMANGLGKVMQGQFDILTKSGFKFSEVEENIFKYGNEAERAALLNQILGSTYSGLNEAMRNTTEGQIKVMKDALGDLAKEMGAAVAPAVVAMTKKISEQIVTLKDWAAKHPQVIAGFVQLGIVLSGLLIVIGSLNKILPAMKVLWLALVSPVGIVIAAIAAAILITANLIRNWDQFKKDVAIIWEAVRGTVVGKIIDMLSWMGKVGEYAGKIFSWLGDLFGGLGTAMVDTVGALGSAALEITGLDGVMQSLSGSVLDVTKGMFDLGDTGAQRFNDLGGAGSKAGDAIKKAAEASVGAWEKVKDEISKVSEEIEDIQTKIAELIAGYDNDRATSAQSVAQAVIDQENKIKEIKERILNESDIAKRYQLQQELVTEQEALAQKQNYYVAYAEQIKELHRVNALTEFEQTLDSISKQEQARFAAFAKEKAELENQLVARKKQQALLLELELSLRDEALAASKLITKTVGNNIDTLIVKYNEMYNAAIRAFSVGGRMSVSSVAAPGRAQGGVVEAGSPYTVGEHGAELFVPSVSGRIIPNGKLAGGGGMTVNIYGGNFLSESAGLELGDQIIEVLRRSLKI